MVSKENSSDRRVGCVSLRSIDAGPNFLPITKHPRALDLKVNQGLFPFWITSEHALNVRSKSV